MSTEPILEARGIAKSFGGIKAVQGVDIAVRDRTPARADRPERRRQDHGLQPDLRACSRRTRARSSSRGRSIAGLSPGGDHRGRDRPLLPDHQPVPGALGRGERAPRRPGAPSAPLRSLGAARALADIERETAALIRYLGLAGIERAEAGALSYGGQRLLDMGLALATKPRVLLLDEPLAGLAAAERQRIGDIIKRISSDLPVLLVEHDIDRVFQIADAVTVMNEGQRAGRRHRRGRAVEPARAGGLYRLRRRDAGGKAARERRRAGDAARRLGGQHLLRQEPHPGRRRASTCTSTRSWRCSAATAPASRRCSRR